MEPKSLGVLLPVECFRVPCRNRRGNPCAPFYRVRKAWLYEPVHRSNLDLGTRHSLLTTSPHSLRTEGWERDKLGILLEFSIPRKEVRIDAVLLIGGRIVILEAKSGSAFFQAKKQIEEYALLLHYFHKASANQMIVPIIVSPEACQPVLDPLRQDEMFPQLAIYWVKRIVTTSWQHLPDVLELVGKGKNAEQIQAESWDESPYHPVPSIIEAAIALKGGLSIGKSRGVKPRSTKSVKFGRPFRLTSIAPGRKTNMSSAF